MADIENTEVSQNTNITKDELIELKKQLATEVVEKLLEKDPNLASSLPKKSMTDYLVDEKTIEDVFHDEILLGGLGELIGLTITPALKKYREMFSSAHTKDDLENLKTTIFNEIGGNLQASTSTQESSNTSTNESSESNKDTDEKKKEETSKTEGGEKQSSDSNNKEKENKENNQDGLDKEKNIYTNPISGLTYKRIDQVTDPAGKLRYSGKRSGKTVADIGCLLASGCTVTSALCPEVTLKDCFNNVRHRTADKAVAKMSNNKWKSEALLSGEHGNRTKAQEQKAKEEIIENLKKGYPAVIGCRHSGIDGTNSSIVSQHYRAILGIRTKNGENEFFVGNTYRNGGGGWLKEKDIFGNMIHASKFTPNQA